MPREILVDWVTPSGSDHRSVFYFATATAVASQRSALSTFLTVLNGSLDDHVAWNIENTGRELDDDTGTLTGVWTHATTFTQVGLGSGEMIPDASQVLMRWNTGTIIAGRFLKGRTYIPGMSTGGMVNGNVSSAIQTAWAAAGASLISAGVGMGVWHRPKVITPGVPGSAGGSFHNATAATVWPELAVLRRRRG